MNIASQNNFHSLRIYKFVDISRSFSTETANGNNSATGPLLQHTENREARLRTISWGLILSQTALRKNT